MTLSLAAGGAGPGARFPGVVNFADLLNLAQHYGQAGTPAEGDLTGDGLVNFNDLLALAQNYGQSFAAITASSDLLKTGYREGAKPRRR